MEFIKACFVTGDRSANFIGSTGTSSFLESSDAGSPNSYDSRQSPPKAIVDTSPLQPAMDKNKECKLNEMLL